MGTHLSFSVSLNRTVLPLTNQVQLVYALLEIVPSGTAVRARLPLNVALVLDHSNSMIVEKKIEHLREAVRYFIDQLDPQDYVSLIIFVDAAEILAPIQPARDLNSLKRLVNQIKTENIPPWEIPIMMQQASGTDALPALKAALTEVKKTQSPKRLSRLILLTDGQLMHPNEVTRIAKRAGNEEIPIIALGVGTDWNDELMQSIAQESGGVADYIADPQEILNVFQKEMASLQATVIQNASLMIRVPAGVEIRKTWRVAPLISNLGNALTVPLGDLERDKGQTLLIELTVPPRQAGNYRIAQTEISFDVPALNVSGEKEQADLIVTLAADSPRYPVNPNVMNIAERVTAFKLQTRALEEARQGNAVGATEKLRSAATILLNQGEADLARTLNIEADHLQRSGDMSENGIKTIKFKGAKTQRIR